MVASALTTDRAQIDRFLRALYQGKPDEHRLLLWDLKRKWSHWSTSIDETIEHAVYSGGLSDLYIGCCTTTSVRTEQQRATVELTDGMPGEWGDLDTKLGHFPDVQTAVDFLLALPRPPSLIVGSGHGAHPWWLYEDYWVFRDDAERQLAQAQMTQHTQTLRAAARAQGWQVDATQDLARVLRIPGTWNFKGEPAPVTILYESDTRYPIERATKLYVVPALPTNGHVQSTAEVRRDIQVQDEQLDQLLESAVPLATWTQTRQAMGKDDDHSPSAYDMSLANYAARAGWSEQQIVDLLIFYRQYHGHGEKYPGYFVNTALEARTAAPERPPPLDQDVPPGTKPQDVTPEQRILLMNRLRTALALPTLARVIEWTQEDPVYVIELENAARIRIGTLRDLSKRGEMRLRLMHDTHYTPLRLNDAKWEEDFIRPVILLAEPRVLGEETTRRGQTVEWIRARLAEREPEPKPPADVARSGKLFYYTTKEGGHGLAIPTQQFAKWVTKEFTKLTPAEFAQRVEEIGGEGVGANYYTADSRRLKVRVQWLPDGWDSTAGDDE